MSKSKKQAAKLKAHRLQVAAQPVTTVSNAELREADDQLVAPEDLEITIETISSILEQPEILSGPRFKELKRVGWDLGKVLAEQGSGSGMWRNLVPVPRVLD
jgi:hypothetical protein